MKHKGITTKPLPASKLKLEKKGILTSQIEEQMKAIIPEPPCPPPMPLEEKTKEKSIEETLLDKLMEKHYSFIFDGNRIEAKPSVAVEG